MTTAIQLHDFQVDATDRLRAMVAEMSEPRRAILVGETGSGKSVMAANLIRRAYERGKAALFVARGRKLVYQFSGHLWSWGVPHGLIMRGDDYAPGAIQVASKDTLISWACHRQRIDLPPAELVVIDECHESVSRWWAWLIESYPRATIIGLTATPARSDGKGLGQLYRGMVQAIPSSELIKLGYLVPCRVFAPFIPDLKGVPVRGGDWQKTELCKRMDQPQLVGDAVGNWKDRGEDRPTFVFCCDIRHSMHVRDEYVKAGIAAEHIDKDSEDTLVDDVLGRLCDGKLKVVCNVAKLRQGVDVPPVSCCQNLRPTRSFVLWRQMLGRIKRPFPGKVDALVLDHSGSVFLHGMPDDDVEWSLEDEIRTRRALDDKPSGPPGDRPPLHCSVCDAVFAAAKACPNCGHEAKRQAKGKASKQGKLVEVGSSAAAPTFDEKERFWKKCLAVMAHRGQSCGAAAAMYRARHGAPPDNSFRHCPSGGDWARKVRDVFPGFMGRNKPAESREMFA